LVEDAPVLYQDVGGMRQAVSGVYVLEGGDRVGFEVGAYDRSRPLVIDPVLSYSTYLGGGGDDGANGIAVDGAGNAYVAGFTVSPNFPTTSGAPQAVLGGFENAFVAKLNAAGSALLYSTYLGGSVEDEAFGIAVDGAGNAYVTGLTSSPNFPTTSGALQKVYGGGEDAFVTKLNAAGSGLLYSTFLGGSNFDFGFGIAVDGAGNAYVTGSTSSLNFPITPGAFQTVFGGGGDPFGDVFVAKLNAAGSGLLYSTFLGGNAPDAAHGIAVDGAGNAYVAGFAASSNFPTTPGAFQTVNRGIDAFVAKLNATGSALLYSTYLGGSRDNNALCIAVDSAGNAYVAGQTDSADFPTTPEALQTVKGFGFVNGFVAKLNAAGSALIYSTYLGGSANDTIYGIDLNDGAYGIVVDGAGNACVVGTTSSPNFPTTPGAFQTVFSGGMEDAYVAKLNAAGSALIYSTYLGGKGFDLAYGIAVDRAGTAYLAGVTSSADFPTTPGAPQTALRGVSNAFVTKISIPHFTLLATGINIQAIAGAPFSGQVATFTNPDPQGTPASYTATISWGDNHISAGLISDLGGGLFAVSGTHTYADPKSYSVQVIITHNLGFTTPGQAKSTATVTSLGQVPQHGQTASFAFWVSARGQALLQSFNGGPSSTALGNWLASSFPNLYGVSAGGHDLTGKSNTQVAQFYQSYFTPLTLSSLDVEVLTTALNVYASTLSLGGTLAQADGFTVDALGLGADSVDVGVFGAAFGVANNTMLNVWELLQGANNAAVGGLLWNSQLLQHMQTLLILMGINEQAGSIH
jgi:hypothetical protein